MFFRSSFLTLVAGLLLASCNTDNGTAPGNPEPVKTRFTYAVTSKNLAPLREGESYSLWAQMGDSLTKLPITLTPGWGDRNNNGSITFAGLAKATKFFLSVDQSPTATSPEAIIAVGANNELSATLSQTSLPLDTLYQTTGQVTFSTFNADTNEAKKAFYFLTIGPMAITPGLMMLPAAPKGWTYSAWVTDSTFEPDHLFYYGSFTTNSGKDSRSTTDEFDYPGGHAKFDLRIPTASIRVTLEPSARPEATRELQPSPFTIVAGSLPRDIELNQEMNLGNSLALPTLTMSFH